MGARSRSSNHSKMAIPKLHRSSATSSAFHGNHHRVAHACESCRQRKTKCNGDRPQCAYCRNYEIECVYAENKKEKTRQELVDSRDRLQRYEGLIQELFPSLDPVAKTTVKKHLGEIDFADINHTNQTPDTESIVDDRLEMDDSSGSVNNASVSDEEIDGIEHTVGGVLTTEGYVGGHSERAWMREFNNALTGSPSDVETFLDNAIFHLDDIDPQVNAGVDLFKLPTRVEADALVETFFAKVHPAVPIFTKQLFMNDYKNFWVSMPHKNDPHSLALLNIVFAISELFHSLNDGMQEMHLIYARRAKQLIGDMLVLGDLVQVQNMALLGFYFLASNQMTRSYLYLGATVRCAMANGLHLPLLNPGFTKVQQESRTRAWLAICYVERASSLATGRPSAINDEHCCHLETKEVEDATFQGIGQAKPATMRGSASDLIFNEQSNLLAIQSRVIKELYPSHLGARSLYRQDCISELLSMMSAWRAQLPDEISIDSIPRGDSNELQKVLLALTYNYIKVMITRPLMLEEHKQQDASESKFHGHITRVCIDAAQQMARLLCARSHDLHVLLNNTPWWYILQFLMGSGVTLIAGIVRFASNADLRPSLISDTESVLNMCQLLESSGNFAARRCVKIMKDLVSVASSPGHECISVQHNERTNVPPYRRKPLQLESDVETFEPSQMDGPTDYDGPVEYNDNDLALHNMSSELPRYQRPPQATPLQLLQRFPNQLSDMDMDMLMEGVVDPNQL